MSALPKPKAYLDEIVPYVGGKTKAKGGAQLIKLSSNENPCGPSPKAIEAFKRTAEALHRYPQDGAADLRAAIAAHYNIEAEQLYCGNGSDEVIGRLIHCYAGPKDEVLFPKHAFSVYRIFSHHYGATPVEAPETDLHTDVDQLLKKVSKHTRLVFIANPNNPTGTYINRDELLRLRAGLREDIILVLDGAYSEYMRDVMDYSNGHDLVNQSNTVVTHTFSKLYGLPSLRVGWGYGPKHIINAMYKVRNPFNVNQAAINAAVAALEDKNYTEAEITRNNRERERVTQALADISVKVTPSFANFILVHFDEVGSKTAQAANDYLMARGIIPREVSGYYLPQCLRVSIGTHEENNIFINTLREFFCA